MDTRPRHPVPLTAYLIAICVVPVVVAASVALVALSRHPDNESDRAAAGDLSRRAPAVEQAIAAEGERLERLATLIARDPKFYASLTLPRSERSKREFREALESVLRDFQRDARTPIFAATDEQGVLLSRALPPDEPVDLTKAPFVLDAVRGRPGHGVLVEMGMAYRVVAVPITAGGVLVGSLCIGTALDAETAGALKEAIGADVMFTIGEAVASTTLAPSPIRKSIAQRIGDRSLDTSGAVRAPSPAGDPARPAPDVDVVGVGGARYLAYHRTIDTPIAGGGPLGFVLIRPLESAASPLVLLRRDLWKAAGMGLLAALVCGGVIAVIVFVRRRRAERAHAAERVTLEDRIRGEQDVLASAAADLKEPASAIGAVASFLATRELGPLSEPQRDGIASIVLNAAWLERTGLDLEDLVRLERRSLVPELRAGDVGALVERAAIELIPAAARRRQTVSFSAEPGLQHERIDEALLYRAIESVAREVLAGAPEGGRMLVEAGRVNGEIAVGIGADAPTQAGPTADPGAAETATAGAATGEVATAEAATAKSAAEPAGDGARSALNGRAPGYLIALARAIAEAHMGALHVRDLGQGRVAYVLRLPRITPATVEIQATDPTGDATPPPVEGEPLPLAS